MLGAPKKKKRKAQNNLSHLLKYTRLRNEENASAINAQELKKCVGLQREKKLTSRGWPL
jgi:hypothetical protein